VTHHASAKSQDEERAYHEVCAYTLNHGGSAFIHQHVVDAYAAQHADENTKPIAITFALVGLYLHVEKGYTGREVQRIHMRLAKERRAWLTFAPPLVQASMTAADVVAAPAGPARDEAIYRWAAAVWKSWSHTRFQLTELLRATLPEFSEGA
jgi:hypothetical protein